MAIDTKRHTPLLDSINAAHERGDMDEVARLAREYAQVATLDDRLNDLNVAHSEGKLSSVAYHARQLADSAESVAKRDREA